MYIGEGKLNYSHHNNPMRSVYVFALSDQILITDLRESKLQQKKFKFIENISLESAQLEASPEDAKRLKNYIFKIKVKNTSSLDPIIYSFQCETLEAYTKWIGDISEAVGCCITKSDNKMGDISELLSWTEDELGFSVEMTRNRTPSGLNTKSIRSLEEDTPSMNRGSSSNSKISLDGSKQSLDRKSSHSIPASPISPLRIGSKFSIEEDDHSQKKPERLQKKRPSKASIN
eukprot:NODE_547_length_6185_cov_0.654124.p5 type:complete len:231 gc:universal NODE_547_length_6185_cov_0.654124:3178-3870(+)